MSVDGRALWMAASIGLAGCGGRDVLTWPRLGPTEAGFIVETKGGLRQPVLGPFAAEGPTTPIELTDSDEVHLIVVDTTELAALHPRVDGDAWDRSRLIDEPVACAQCDGPCRDETNDRLFHPLGALGRTFQIEGEAFEVVAENPWATLWIELAAKWSCTDVSQPSAFERVERWPVGPNHDRLKAFEHGAIVALGDGLRVLGEETELFLRAPPESWIRDAVSNDAERIYAAAPRLDAGPGAVLELALGPGRLEILREIPMPFHVVHLHLDARGLVVLGENGEIATSTDTFTFEYSQIAQRPEVSAFRRLGRGERPFLIGIGSGGVLRGDPWAPELAWTQERVNINVDSTTSEFLRSQLGEDSVLWARTLERGLFIQKNEEPWESLAVEMPLAHPRCRLRTDVCGFGEPPARTRYSDAHESSVLTLADNCPALLAFDLERACTSSIELLEEGEATDRPRAVVVQGDYLYVLVPDGVLRAPLALLW